MVVLRRYDHRALRDWTQYHTAYETEERLEQLTAVTGGWPVLLDRVLKLRESHRDQDRAVRELQEWLAHREGARELVEAVGLLRDDSGADDDPADPYAMVRTGYEAVVEELGTGWNLAADCETAIELAGLAPDDARWALTCLETLQVFDRDGARLRVEPVLHAALGVVAAEK